MAVYLHPTFSLHPGSIGQMQKAIDDVVRRLSSSVFTERSMALRALVQTVEGVPGWEEARRFMTSEKLPPRFQEHLMSALWRHHQHQERQTGIALADPGRQFDRFCGLKAPESNGIGNLGIEPAKDGAVDCGEDNNFCGALRRGPGGKWLLNMPNPINKPSVLRVAPGYPKPPIIYIAEDSAPPNRELAYFSIKYPLLNQNQVADKVVNFYRERLKSGRGFQFPAEVYRDLGTGSHVLREGYHRWFAALSEGFDYLLARIIGEGWFEGASWGVPDIRMIPYEEMLLHHPSHLPDFSSEFYVETSRAGRRQSLSSSSL